MNVSVYHLFSYSLWFIEDNDEPFSKLRMVIMFITNDKWFCAAWQHWNFQTWFVDKTQTYSSCCFWVSAWLVFSWATSCLPELRGDEKVGDRRTSRGVLYQLSVCSRKQIKFPISQFTGWFWSKGTVQNGVGGKKTRRGEMKKTPEW